MHSRLCGGRKPPFTRGPGEGVSQDGGVEAMAPDTSEPFRSGLLLEAQVDVLLLVSRGNVEEDLATIREAHSTVPDVRILLIGTTSEDGEFLQYVRAG